MTHLKTKLLWLSVLAFLIVDCLASHKHDNDEGEKDRKKRQISRQQFDNYLNNLNNPNYDPRAEEGELFQWPLLLKITSLQFSAIFRIANPTQVQIQTESLVFHNANVVSIVSLLFLCKKSRISTSIVYSLPIFLPKSNLSTFQAGGYCTRMASG